MLNKLNDRQLEAVTTVDGPLLIIAGAGSGKTTVIVNRIVYMITEKNIPPYNIMAITFTNKAANEMRERIEGFIGEIPKGMWVGTFHSICVKILRSCIDVLGYKSDFVIYDTSDVKTLVKDCIKELGFDTDEYEPRFVASRISDAKNKMYEPSTLEYTAGADYTTRDIAKIYALYQKKLKSNNAVDFDDIIFHTVKIFNEHSDILARYQERFKYIMVDEYQDTDNTQYLLINLLAQKHHNIAVVGDDDQSIYRFRGANIENILGFEDDYPEARRVVLDRNYRSTENILNAANAVIANNQHRMGKNLWSDKGAGEKLCAYTAINEKEEGRFIAAEIAKHHNSGRRYSDCAVLYRANAQSRAIETELRNMNIPYRILSGLRFYDRKEIKDILAYLRLVHNPDDDLSLIRVINEPKRKIGNTTIGKLNMLALENNSTMFSIAKHASQYSELKSAAARIEQFTKIIDTVRDNMNDMAVSEIVTTVQNLSGYIAALKAENNNENRTRLENIEEFMTVVKSYETDSENEGITPSLAGFLESVTLSASVDDLDENEDAAVLMTIHSAKGLEFPVVFIAGMEERLFPGTRSISDPESLDEERRLCYVAMTRAKEKLYITKTEERFLYGKTEHSIASRFWNEIPEEYIEDNSPKKKKVFEYVFERPKKPGFWNSNAQTKSKQTKSDSGPELRIGDRVRHKTFGKGTVIKSDGNKSATILQIAFDNAGTKTLIAEYAKLEKI
ncbi:MAG: 3'-5' exonuclease [bacterium]|nr:3'-5' exonuclease [bacterium]